MPSLVLFRHRTPVSGDDLRLLCVLYTGLRLAQIGMIIYLVVKTSKERAEYDAGSVTLQCQDEDGNDILVEDSNLARYLKNFIPVAWIYVLGSLVLAVCYIITDVSVWKISDTGSPTEPQRRQKLGHLCSFRLLTFGLARLLIFTTGILIASDIEEYCDCRVYYRDTSRRRFLEEIDGGRDLKIPLGEEFRGCEDQVKVFNVFAVLLTSQGVEVILPLIAAVFICLKSGRREASRVTKQESRWKLCCACCCNLTSIFTCCICGGKDVNTGGYRDISKALATYFGGDLDLTFTDKLAGFITLLRVQRQRKLECRRALIQAKDKNTNANANARLAMAASRNGMVEQRDETSGEMVKEVIVYRLVRSVGKEHVLHYAAALRRVLSPHNSGDFQVITEGAYYCRLALGIYGWLMTVLESPATGCCKVGYSWCKHPQSRCCSRDKDHIHNDTLLGCNEVALRRYADLQADQIKYASFAQGFTETPYCITVDDEKKTVVVTIRGTLSLDDAVADLTIKPVLLDNWADRFDFAEGKGEFCHSGMLNISTWIYEDLQRHGTLEKLLGEDGECSGHELIILGHSLGAGCAAVLTTMLKANYPSVRCLAFSPPGSVFSRTLANHTKDFVVSYVLGDDVVPRLSLHSMENLRHELLSCIARIKVPKYKVLRPLGKKADIIEANAKMLHKTPSHSAFWQTVQDFEKEQALEKTEKGPEIVLCPPGKVCHLYRTFEDDRWLPVSFSMKRRPDEYVAHWAEPDDLGEIIVNAQSIADHQPFHVCAELERVSEMFGA